MNLIYMTLILIMMFYILKYIKAKYNELFYKYGKIYET